MAEKITFGDMRKRDEDNLRLVLPGCREIPFENPQDGMKWINDAMQGIMMKFGIDKNGIIEKALRMPIDSFIMKRFKEDYIKMSNNPKAMKLFGNPVNGPKRLYAAYLIDQQQKKRDLIVEDREYTKPNQQWKSGIYIYHHDEIAYFLSKPYTRKGGNYYTGTIIVPVIGRKWFVQSNWDESKPFVQVQADVTNKRSETAGSSGPGLPADSGETSGP